MPLLALPAPDQCPITSRTAGETQPPKGRLRRRRLGVPKSLAYPKNGPKNCMDAMDRTPPATATGKSTVSRTTFNARVHDLAPWRPSGPRHDTCDSIPDIGAWLTVNR